jgi:flavodoxin
MKHESIVVVYDSCQAIAEEIADKLGAETIGVQSMNSRHIENSQSFVLAIEFQADGQLTPHWMYAYLTLRGVNLKGKNIAVFVALGNKHDNNHVVVEFCDGLKENGAHIVGELSYVGSPEWNTDNWVCIMSPNL